MYWLNIYSQPDSSDQVKNVSLPSGAEHVTLSQSQRLEACNNSRSSAESSEQMPHQGFVLEVIGPRQE